MEIQTSGAHALTLIRATRANPPVTGKSPMLRRRIYSAALEQFEQLMRAAVNVGAPARPLLLFYALGQAGRAIVAARGEEAEASGHGLGFSGQAEPGDLLSRSVTPDGSGSLFAAFVQATGSQQPSAPVRLGAAWAALPGAPEIPQGDWPRPLSVWAFPGDDLAPTYHLRPHAALVAGYAGDADSLQRDLGFYPAAADAKVAHGGILQTPHGKGYDVEWPQKSSPPAQSPGQPCPLRATSRLPCHRGVRYLLPAVGEGRDLLPPVLLWWLLLFGLSNVARYEPGVWSAVLDVDSSPIAVPLERLLEVAVEELPGVVHDVLVPPTRPSERSFSG